MVSLILYEFLLTTLLMAILLGDIKSYHDLSCYMYIYGQLTSVILLPLQIHPLFHIHPNYVIQIYVYRYKQLNTQGVDIVIDLIIFS